ncbi:MAG TPA: Ig-like domain-containing protein [Gemmatimonadaceae bacterium]|nr:Ig-like domain-containing protein [Gemmatimonadaceae bacterium]
MATVTVTPSPIQLTAVGATAQLTATARSAEGDILAGRSFVWSSSNTSVATVNESGVVSAVANGSASISASTSGVVGNASVEVSIPGSPVLVSAGFDHTCAVNAEGVAYCWGRNTLGQLGDGTTTSRSLPTAVQGNLRFRTISAGQNLTCGVTIAGEGYCWGSSDRGQVGDGGLGNRTAPSRVVGVPTFSSIQAGRAHSCGLATTGIVYCWGWGSNGESGSGALVATQVAPDSVHGGRRFTALAGAAHTICAIATTGEPYCWGRNNTGQVGDGTTTCTSLSASCFDERALPTRVVTGDSFAGIGANARIVNGFGGGTSCGVATSSEGYCWGQNTNGQIGDGSTGVRLVPTLVSGNHSWRSIAVGSATTCGVTTAGVGLCWGFNGTGSVGDGTTVHRLIPTAVTGGLTLSTISVGYDHACAVTSIGDVYCWGANPNGELGDGTTSGRAVPGRVDVPS